MSITTYSSANLGSKSKLIRAVSDRNLMFMSEAERLIYWAIKAKKPKAESSNKCNTKAKKLDEKQVLT